MLHSRHPNGSKIADTDAGHAKAVPLARTRVRTHVTVPMSVKKTLRIYESIWSCGSIRGE
jgi:hypothetical protein